MALLLLASHSPLSVVQVEESSSFPSWATGWYCRLNTIIWMVLRRFLINDTSQFKIHGPNVSINNSTISGPRRVEIKVVSQGERWNQDSNHLCWASRSLFDCASPSLTFAIDLLPLLYGLHRINILFPEPHRPHPVGEKSSLSYSARPLQTRKSKTSLSDWLSYIFIYSGS